MQLVREDWKLFRNIETLCQKAGVHRQFIPPLVVKELINCVPGLVFSSCHNFYIL
jgi:hypothetical protein